MRGGRGRTAGDLSDVGNDPGGMAHAGCRSNVRNATHRRCGEPLVQSNDAVGRGIPDGPGQRGTGRALLNQAGSNAATTWSPVPEATGAGPGRPVCTLISTAPALCRNARLLPHAGCCHSLSLIIGTSTVGKPAPSASHRLAMAYVSAMPHAALFTVLKVAGQTATADGSGPLRPWAGARNVWRGAEPVAREIDVASKPVHRGGSGHDGRPPAGLHQVGHEVAGPCRQGRAADDQRQVVADHGSAQQLGAA